jgi:hypothetical protein
LIIVLKSSPARQVDLGLQPGWVEKKQKKKNSADLARSNCNPLTFVFLFLLKQRRFDFLKKNN